MTADQLSKAVVAAGLVPADELQAYWNALTPEQRAAADGSAFATLLIKQGKLTEFQARQVLGGRGAALVMGEYVILSEIGAGGMGRVYKARHRRMDRIVALKVMSQAAMKDEAAVKRFQREVRAAAKLEHPNIVAAHDAGESGKTHFLVMQFVDGGDLSDLVKRHGPLDVGLACDFVIQAARGLAYAHAEGVIHRDIKPANLLVDKKGVVKILDMGLARFESGNDALTGTEQVMGTVDFMSPEQAAETKSADARADIYSLGCTLWYLLTGKKTYDGDTLVSRLMKHRDAPLPSLVKERDDAPWPLEQALHKMLAKRAQDRFQTMDEVATALEPFRSGGSSVMSGSHIGGGSSINDPQLASFMQSSGTKQATATGAAAKKAAPMLTAARIEPTAAFSKADVDTDPKSEMFLGSKAGAATPRGTFVAKGSKNPTPAGAGKKSNNRNLLIGAGGLFTAALVALGIWIVIRDGDGNKVAELHVADGATVEVRVGEPSPTAAAEATSTSAPTPSPTAASPMPLPEFSTVATATPSAKATVPAPAATSPDGWQSLFNGTDLTGWRGDVTTFRVENGAIVTDGAKGDLITLQEYSDFEVEAEFRLADGANSGLGIRYGGTDRPRLNGMEVQLWDPTSRPADAIDGYGSLMELAAPTAQPFNRWPQWNSLRVACRGRLVTVEINGTLANRSDLNDLARRFPEHRGLRRTAGSICLITTGGHSEFRKLRVRESTGNPPTLATSAPAITPQPAPTGTSTPAVATASKSASEFNSWQGLPQFWTVSGNEVIGSSLPGGGSFNTCFVAPQPYRDFELSCQIKIMRGNTGIQIRSEYEVAETFRMRGPQVDCGDKFWGCLYGERTVGMMQAADATLVGRILKPNDYNDVHVRCYGQHVTIRLNGETTVDGEFPAMAREGLVGLQLHSGPSEIAIRNLSIRPLNADGSPTATGAVTPTPVVSSAPTRRPIPAAADLQKARGLVNDLFKAEFAAAKQAPEKTALGDKLLAEAVKNVGDVNGHYALLQAALELAVEAGDPALIDRVVGALSGYYTADPHELRITALADSARKSQPRAAAQSLAEAALRYAESANEAETFDIAKRYADVAAAASRSLKDAALTKQVGDRTKEINDAKIQFDAVAKARGVLAEKPDDPAANLTVGRDLCFGRGRWEEGFPYLAKGSDAPVADLAKRSLAAPATADEQAALGDAWWQASEAASTKRKAELQAAARYWYEKALPGLSGLAKATIEKRLAEAAASPPARGAIAGFKPLFNGRDLSGWQFSGGGTGNWIVENGVITCTGGGFNRLYTQRSDFADFHVRAEVLISDGGNGGLHVRTPPGMTSGGGYEAQVNSTAPDRNRTGSLYIPGQGMVYSVPQTLVPPNTWFTLEVLARGNRIGILVNGTAVVDYVDAQNTFGRGHIALEHHDPQTKIYFRRVDVKEFPAGR